MTFNQFLEEQKEFRGKLRVFLDITNWNLYFIDAAQRKILLDAHSYLYPAAEPLPDGEYRFFLENVIDFEAALQRINSPTGHPFLIYKSSQIYLLAGPVTLRKSIESDSRDFQRNRELLRYLFPLNQLNSITGMRNTRVWPPETEENLNRIPDLVDHHYGRIVEKYSNRSYLDEQRVRKAFRRHDMDEVIELTKDTNFSLNPPSTISPKRWARLNMIYLIWLFADEVLKLNVNTVYVYYLRDVYIIKIETAVCIADILEIMRQALNHFMKLHKELSFFGYSTKVKMTMKYIEDRLYEPITVMGAAEVVGIHPDYLSSVFKKETGTTFNSYVHSRKMIIAGEMLLNSSTTISEISDFLGYGSLNTFIRRFKTHYGVSPGEYRSGRQR